MSLAYKPMPGYVICEIMEGETHTSGFQLPDQEPSHIAKVTGIGPHVAWWKRLLMYPFDLHTGDHILINNVIGRLHENTLVIQHKDIKCIVKNYTATQTI